MKKITSFFFIFITALLLVSCTHDSGSGKPYGAIDATEHGVSTDNSGAENSKNLQKLIDSLSSNGGTVYIPAGRYEFAENGRQTIGAHCIKMRSNVSIVGVGDETVLLPVGASQNGLDMFYFNDYLDTGEGVYLENCRFEGFVIDAARTSCDVYTSAGKGFMFNLFRNCHWEGVTVKNTDATGFGVDCPVDSSISRCAAIGCGKAAREDQGGASGFGIGFGYRNGENITISECSSQGNKRFGFFFEHQGRFDSQKYSATESHDFLVSDSTASGNLYNFGGLCATSARYEDCLSSSARQYGFYFENSSNSSVRSCTGAGEAEASFAILQSGAYNVNEIAIVGCSGSSSPIGVKVTGAHTALMSDVSVRSCKFSSIGAYTVSASGKIKSLSLTYNSSDISSNSFDAEIDSFENSNNSWN